MVRAVLATGAIAAVMFSSSPSWAQSDGASSPASRSSSSSSSGPRAGDRVAGGVGLLLSSLVLEAPVAVSLAAVVPQGGGPAIAVGVVGVVSLVVGIVEIVAGSREWRDDARARPVSLGPGGITVTF